MCLNCDFISNVFIQIYCIYHVDVVVIEWFSGIVEIEHQHGNMRQVSAIVEAS